MPVSFIIGRAGTGKTHHCRTQIVRALQQQPLGPPIFWLLPRQSTFTAERDLTVASGLRGFCRAHVVSFEMLGHAIVRDAGGMVPAVTPIGRQMILGHLLRQHQSKLKFYAGVAHQIGLAASLDATLGELERSGVEPENLREILQRDAGGFVGGLADKLHDVHLIFQAYRSYLGQDRLDQHLRLIQVLQRIETSRIFREAVIYVDGFVRFTHYERAMLARIAKVCREMTITLLMDPQSPILAEPDLLPEELSHFHPVESAFRDLWFAFRQHQISVDWPPTLLGETYRFTTPALCAIERQMFATDDASSPETHDGVELFEANNRLGEVEAAARKIQELTTSGLRFRDIVLLVRDLEQYHDALATTLGEHHIPLFIDRRRTAWHHPLLALLRQALTLADGRWDHDALMSLLKGGLSGAAPGDADLLENYVLRHRLEGKAWTDDLPWQYHRARRHDRDPTAEEATAEQNLAASESARADALRRLLVSRVQPLAHLFFNDALVPVSRVAAELLLLLERFEVREQMQDWIAKARLSGSPEAAAEHEQVWSGLTDLLDQLVEVLGDEPLRLGDLQQIVESVLQGFDLALTPPTVDQVLIGQIDRTRAAEARAVLILGLGEGLFPRASREDSVLTDADRRALTQRQLQIDPGATRRLLDETLLGYIALTGASEHLWLSRPIGEEGGKPLGPSRFWLRLRQMFPGLPVHTQAGATQASGVLGLIATPRQLLSSLMYWARMRESYTDEVDQTFGAIYEWFRTEGRHLPQFAHLTDLAWSALTYENQAALSPAAALQLFGDPLNASARRLEEFAACPFRHFVKYGLELSTREEGEVSAIDLSSAYRRVLGDLVRQMVGQKQSWNDIPPAHRARFIEQMAHQIGQELRGEILLSTARNRYLLRHVTKTLELVAANQGALQRRGRFYPAKADVSFGPTASQPPLMLQTPEGHALHLRGKIDRVDVAADGAQLMFAVIDYRMREQQLSLDKVRHGLDLQLLASLLAIHARPLGTDELPWVPVAAFYVQLLREICPVNHPDDAPPAGDEALDLDCKPRGIFDQRALPALDRGLKEGASQVVNARINKDGGLGKMTDSATTEQFEALLSFVHQRLIFLTDEILGGAVAVRPFLMGKKSACITCSYQPFCRFDKAINQYHKLPVLGRVEVLQQITESEGA